MLRMTAVAQAVADAAYAEEGLHAVVQAACDLFGAQTVALVLLDEGAETSHIKLARGLSAGFISAFSRSLSSGLMAEVVHGGHALRISEADPEDEVYGEVKLEHDFGSALAVQLTINRQPLGCLYVDHRDRGRFGEEDLQLLRCLGHLAALALERASLRDAVARLAAEDHLTGLATYSYLHRRLAIEIERALRYDESVGVLLMEILNLAYVEDVYGRDGAHELLRHLARIVQENTRGVDFSAHFRANTFMTCLVRSDGRALEAVAHRIISAAESLPATCVLSESGRHRGETATVPVEICAGGALAPAQARDASTVVSTVEKALIAARRAGAGNFVLAKS